MENFDIVKFPILKMTKIPNLGNIDILKFPNLGNIVTYKFGSKL